jgi:hypothetical protein
MRCRLSGEELYSRMAAALLSVVLKAMIVPARRDFETR